MSKQKKGIDYDEKFSPVVAWSMLFLLLILTAIQKLKMRQVDYVQAFSQALLEEPVCMCIPLVIHYKDFLEDKSHYVVRLKKNLYDLKQTVMNWYHKLRHGLLARGYTQSVVDTYLFIKDDVLCLIYVDDTIFFAKDQSLIDREITDLKQHFDLTDEGEVDAFLGIDINMRTMVQ